MDLRSVGGLELAEEAQVVLGEHTEVFHAIFEVGYPLHAHAERIARELL